MISDALVEVLRAAELPLELHRTDEAVVATVVPVSGAHTQLRLATPLATALNEANCERLIIDVSGLTSVDSTGLGAMVAFADLVTGGQELAVIGVGNPIRALFDMLGLGAFFPLYDDRRSALLAFGAILPPNRDAQLMQLLDHAVESARDPAPLGVAADYLSEREDPRGARLTAALADPRLTFESTRSQPAHEIVEGARLILPLGPHAEAVFLSL